MTYSDLPETIEMACADRSSMRPAYVDDVGDDGFHDEAMDDLPSSRGKRTRWRTVCIRFLAVGLVAVLAIVAWSTASAFFTKSGSGGTDVTSDDGKNDFKEETSSEFLGGNGEESESVAGSGKVENEILDVDVPASDVSGKIDTMVEQDMASTSSFDLRTGNRRIDRAYNLAKKELEANIADKKGDTSSNNGRGEASHFVGGSGWEQLWTRDTSYAIELAAGLVAPDVSLNSLLQCVETVPINTEGGNRSVWYQDECGHFGGWPYLSDSIVGARGSYSLYLYTGNTTLLNWAYETTVYSLKRAEQDSLRHGLFHGCSSFMESNSGYPSKYEGDGKLVGRTKALSTNMLYYNGYKLASEMGRIILDGGAKRSSTLSEDILENLKTQADNLKTEIRKRFWIEDMGIYAYFEDENGDLVKHMEGLGESLVLLSEEFEDASHRIRSILDSTYRSEIGVPCLWPRFNRSVEKLDDKHISSRYHNGRIWPFVMGYFAIAAARKGRIDIFASEMANLIKLSEQGNTFAEFYELDMSK